MVILSLIMPRLDSKHLNRRAQKVNTFLKDVIYTAFMHTLFTYRIFLKKGKINSSLYCTLDKIHLCVQGNKLLFKYYTTRISEICKAMSLTRGEALPPPKKINRKSNLRG